MFTFLLSTLFVLALVYIPGIAVLSTLRFRGATLVGVAPLVSIFLFEALAVVYQKVGIQANAVSLIVPAVILTIVCVIVSLLLKNRGEVIGAGSSKISVLYVAIGLIVGAIYFLMPLESINAFCQEWDNTTHINMIKSFVETGNYSTLAATSYGIGNMSPTGIVSSVGFYPAAWHMLCAILVSALGVSVTASINVVNFALSAVIFQTSMACFLSVLFEKDERLLRSGAIIASAFFSFPWLFLVYGPIFPNLMAFSLMPAAMAFFILFFRENCKLVNKILIFVVFLISCATLAVAQTNALFAAVLILWPFLTSLVARKSNGKKATVYLIMTALFIGIWYVFYKLPMLQGVYSFTWSATAGKWEAIVDILTTTYRGSVTSLPLVLALGAGIYVCFKEKQHRWLAVSYAICCFCLWVDLAFDGTLKHYLVGAFYTDQFRVAAVVSVAAIPVATLGLAKIIEYFENRFCQREIVLLLCAAILVYLPSCDIKGLGEIETPFGHFKQSVAYEYNTKDAEAEESAVFLDEEEEEFLNQVAEITNKTGGIVINCPYDGSAFAYGLDEINILYRTLSVSSANNNVIDNIEIRLRLNEISTNSAVQSSVKALNAQYVLLLDNLGNKHTETLYPGFEKSEWKGLISITDNTEGFELLLSKGDMRLYKIVAQ